MITLALALAAAQAGSPAASAPAPVASPAPVDPARLKIAERIVLALVPPGIYASLMRDKMPAMVDGMMAQMSGMTARDMGLPGDADDGETMEQTMAKADPAYRERMAIMNRVMFAEMGDVFGKMEPALRAGMSRAFARKYDVRQLTDMDAFFTSPSGKAFANDYLATFMDPEVIGEMMRMAPEMMKAMPEIMKKVEAATAHLPPPPKPKAASDE